VRGYTAADFEQTASDAVGFDLKPLMRKLVATTEEIEYTEMLDWFGLRFKPQDASQPADPAKAWTLEVRPDASAAQKANLTAFLSHSRAK
jgi:predicted metalloprotease with PDZ domain